MGALMTSDEEQARSLSLRWRRWGGSLWTHMPLSGLMACSLPWTPLPWDCYVKTHAFILVEPLYFGASLLQQLSLNPN